MHPTSGLTLPNNKTLYYPLIWMLISLIPLTFKASAGQFSFLINPSSTLQQEAYYEMVMDFEKQNPGFKVKIIAKKPESFREEMTNFSDSGTPPADVMMAYAGIQLRTLQKLDFIAPLNGVWTEENLKEAVSEASFKAISIDEDPYALPLSYYQWGIYYKNSVFEELDITAPETLPQLLEVVQKLRDNNVEPFSFSAKSPWTILAWLDYLNLRVNGAEFHRHLLNGKISFHDDRMQVVLEWWNKLLHAGAFHQTANLSWEQSLPYLYRDISAMTLMGNFFLAHVPEELQSNFKFMPFPYLKGQNHFCEDVPLDVLILSKQARENQHALKFLQFVADAQTQRKFNRKVGKISPHKNSSVQENYFIKEGRQLIENADHFNHFFDRETPPEFASSVAAALVESVRNEQAANNLVATLESLRLKHLVVD